MKIILIIATFVAFVFLTQSCTKDKVPLINNQQLWDCNLYQNYDSTKLASKLIGSWKWTAYFGELSGDRKANKDVTVIFTSASTFTVIENSVVVLQGNWKLRIGDSNIYTLDLDKSSSYLYGLILLCENQVLFSDSYIDGEDNLFVRTN